MKPMKTSRLLIPIAVLAATLAQAADSIRWVRQVLTDQYYCDGINSGDFNRDGKMDILAGPFWYEGSERMWPRSFFRPHCPDHGDYLYLVERSLVALEPSGDSNRLTRALQTRLNFRLDLADFFSCTRRWR